MLPQKRVDDLTQITFHDLVELVQSKVDAMIGHPPLRKIVSTDSFRAVTATYQTFAGTALGFCGCLLLGTQQFRLQQ